MKTNPTLLLICVLISGCNQAKEVAEPNAEEVSAATNLGLIAPVQPIMLKVSTCTELTLIDKARKTIVVCVSDNTWCTESPTWQVGRCREPDQDDYQPGRPADVEFLLGIWLQRNFSREQLEQMSTRNFPWPQGTEPEYIASFLFMHVQHPELHSGIARGFRVPL